MIVSRLYDFITPFPGLNSFHIFLQSWCAKNSNKIGIWRFLPQTLLEWNTKLQKEWKKRKKKNPPKTKGKIQASDTCSWELLVSLSWLWQRLHVVFLQISLISYGFWVTLVAVKLVQEEIIVHLLQLNTTSWNELNDIFQFDDLLTHTQVRC